MAEGLLSGLLRNDEAAPVVKAPEALAGPKSVAVAIADHASSQKPEVARQLAARLGKQAQRLETRAEQRKYHHRLRLENLSYDLREAWPGLLTHSISMRRRAFFFSPSIAHY